MVEKPAADDTVKLVTVSTLKNEHCAFSVLRGPENKLFIMAFDAHTNMGVTLFSDAEVLRNFARGILKGLAS